MLFHQFDSPYGEVLVWGDGAKLEGVRLPGQQANGITDQYQADQSSFVEAERQLHAYFAGQLHKFDLPLKLKGTDFQCRVWQELAEVGYGETLSYQELAERVQCKGGARAVGNAMGQNILSVVVPCHRVIGSDGNLGGYGGGLHLKRDLLKLEGAGVG